MEGRFYGTDHREVGGRGKTATGRAWVYVRDDAPFGGADLPAALFHYSRDRSAMITIPQPPNTSTSSAITCSSPSSAPVSTTGSKSGLTGSRVIFSWRQESPCVDFSLL